MNLLWCLPIAMLPLLAQDAGDPRLLLLGAHTADGRFVRGISADQIAVRHVRASVRSVTLDTRPRRIALLCDISGSREGVDPCRWSYVLSLLKDLVANAQPDDSISLHCYAKAHQLLVPSTHDFRELRRQIDSMPPPPETPVLRPELGLLAGLHETVSEIMQNPSENLGMGDAIVLVSEEGYINDRGRWNTVGELVSRGLRLFRLRIIEHEPLAGPYLKGINLSTSGGIAIPWASSSAEEARAGKAYMQAVYSLIRYVYRVELQTNRSDPDFRNLRIDVRDRSGAPSRRIGVIYQRSRDFPRPPTQVP